jgi:hypothetical protein
MPLVTILTEAQATAINQAYCGGSRVYNIGSDVTIPSDTPTGRRVLRYFWTQLRRTTQAMLTAEYGLMPIEASPNAIYEPPCERLWDITPLPLPN